MIVESAVQIIKCSLQTMHKMSMDFNLFNDAFSATQIIQHRMKEWQVNNKLERMWKKVVMTWFKVLPWNLPRGTEENHKNPASITSLWAEIWNRDLPNMKQECYPLNYDIWSTDFSEIHIGVNLKGAKQI
jgi:hypothetical protein